MGTIRHWCSLAVVAAAIAALGGTSAAHAEGKSPSHVKLEFWQGHFNRDSLAFHYWDKAKEVPAVCARCHGADSVPEYLKEGKTAATPHVKNAFTCTNCHADMQSYARHAVAKVNFPSGISIDSGNNDGNLCMTCHQGRESTASVNKALAGKELDKPDPALNFIHVHYALAGATLYGTQAKVAFEFPGKSYAGRFAHTPTVNNCTGCHEAHTGEVKIDRCGGCHDNVATTADLPNVRMASNGDFDGNGKEEGIGREIASMQRALYAGIQTYAKSVGGKAIAFSSAKHPYWHTDTNGNGIIDPDELNPANKYTAYTPRLSQAVYNYTVVLREPGAAYHNGRYTLQILYDTLESLAASGKAGIDMKGMVRPADTSSPACAEVRPGAPAGASC